MCECANDARCDPVSGDCLCGPGWSGAQCTQRKLRPLLSSLFYARYTHLGDFR